MENENSYLNIKEGTSEKMFENQINFDATFLSVLNKTAADILIVINKTKFDTLENPHKSLREFEEREIPDSKGQVLTLVSIDGVAETEAFVYRMQGHRLSTGPFELHGKMFCIFH